MRTFVLAILFLIAVHASRSASNCSELRMGQYYCDEVEIDLKTQQAAHAPIDWVEFAACAVFYLPTVVFGFAFNMLALYVVLRPKFNQQTSRLSKVDLQCLMSGQSDERIIVRRNYRRVALRETLLFLCTCDIVVILVCIPLRFVRWFTYTWTFGYFLCKTVFYLQYWIGICSILALTLVTLQRYYAAAHPLTVHMVWTTRKRRGSLALIGIAAALLASPVLASQVHKPVGAGAYWCMTEFSSDAWLIAFELYLYVILIVMPLMSMIVVYTVIVRKVSAPQNEDSATTTATGGGEARRSSTRSSKKSLTLTAMATATTQIAAATTIGKSRPKEDFRRSRNRRVLLMSIVTVTVFALCWMPYQTDRLLSAYGLVNQYNVGRLRHLRMATTLLSHANACLNPLVYCISSSHFRKSAAQIFR